MRRLKSIALILCLVSLATNALSALPYDRKFDEFEFRDCINLIARLDNLAVSINDDTEATGLIRVYGGQVVKRGEIQMYISLITNYLVQRRGVEARRLKVVFSGYWKKAGVEIYIVPSGAVIPDPRPLLKQKDVTFIGEQANDRKYKCAKGLWN